MALGQFDEKIALVTGGGSGIGKATARAFAGQGATVIIADRDKANGEAVCQSIRDAKGEAYFREADVSDASAVKAMLEWVAQEHARLDIAFNNAGVTPRIALTADQEEADFLHIFSVDLKGVWLCMKYEIHQMLAQNDGGSIVNVSAVAGLKGAPYSSLYAACKNGILGLTKTAALEYKQNGIRINAVCPGDISTPQLTKVTQQKQDISISDGEVFLPPKIQKEKIGQPEDVANAVLWLSSEASSHVIGQALVVDGGFLIQ